MVIVKAGAHLPHSVIVLVKLHDVLVLVGAGIRLLHGAMVLVEAGSHLLHGISTMAFMEPGIHLLHSAVVAA
jgi:hypothetical protein